MSKGKSTTTTTTDPAQMAMYQGLYDKSQSIASQPFVPYTGARVAGFNPDQLQGFDATRNMFGQSMSFNPRSQLNQLAYQPAPSINLPFGYSQQQQPFSNFQPSIQQGQFMPFTGGGGRPVAPPSIGGIGGREVGMPSPSQGLDPRALKPRGLPVGNNVLGGGGINYKNEMGGSNFGGPVGPLPSEVSQAEKDFYANLQNGSVMPMGGLGEFVPPQQPAFTPLSERTDIYGEGKKYDPANLPEGFSYDSPRDGNNIYSMVMPSMGNVYAYGPDGERREVPSGIQSPGFNTTILGGLGDLFNPGLPTDTGPTFSSDPFRKKGFSNQTPTQGNPFAPTQLQPAAMQQASTIRPVERFGGANITSLANFGGANISPVERFGGANISPVDLYSGASVNRGDVRDVKPQSLLSTDLGAYQNPFQSQVIDNTLGDLNKARQLQIQSDQDAAIGRGAFGGSRSALLESETNRNFAEEAARASGNLRSQGFDRATSLAGQDIGRQFDADRYMSDADRAIAMQNATFGQQAGLAKQGLLGDVSLNQARLNQQAGLSGMDAFNRRALQQGQFQQQAGMADMDAFNRAAMQGAQFRQQAGMAGADASNRAGSQQAQLNASRFGANQDALNRFGLQQGQFNNQMNMGMFDAANRAAFMQPGLEMQNRQFQSGLLNNQLSDQYRNLGLLSGIGSQQQGLQQAGLDSGYEQFGRAINYGPQQLNLLSQGVSAMPSANSTSDQYKPGTADYLQTALSLFGLSDKRLKENIKLVDKVKGHNVYTWDWNDTAKKLGVTSPTKGVIAQEILQSNPEAIALHESGYLMVNYGAL